MADKDFDLNKILSESFRRLDELAVKGGNQSEEKSGEGEEALQNGEAEDDLSSLTLGKDKGAGCELSGDDPSAGSEGMASGTGKADDLQEEQDLAEDEWEQQEEDGEPYYEDEEPYDEDEEPYDEDEDFVEEYQEVVPRRKLQFNMRSEEPEKKQRRRRKKVKKNNSIFTGALITVIVVSVSFILAFGCIQLGVEYMGLTRSDETISFEIPEGTTSETAADLLYQKGIIGNPSLFRTVMKLSGKTDVVSGSITLSPNMTYPSIIAELVRSRKVYETVTVTFTEGMSLYKAAKLLEQKNVCNASDFLSAFNESSGFDFEQQLSLTPQTLYKMEGFCFPDTYEFYIEDEPENVVNKIKTNFASKMDDSIMKLVEKSGMSLYDVVTLASIVQAEASTEEDMKLVASVFLNRLAAPSDYPNLESDATYFYVTNTIASALGNTSVSSYEGLYNTYTCFGLPIGPIGNPGMQAILAVLEPAQSDFYFFVTDSATGQFYYAQTYEEHQENCKKAGY